MLSVNLRCLSSQLQAKLSSELLEGYFKISAALLTKQALFPVRARP